MCSENTREAEMSSPNLRFAPIGAVALAIGLATASALFAFAYDGSQLVPELCVTPAAAGGAEAPFLAENDAAMKKMMSDMTVAPTGGVDADFVAMMVAQRQGAIDLAVWGGGPCSK